MFAVKKPENIKTTKCLREFEDDHIPCAKAKINGVVVDLFWCGSRVVGALDFASRDSKAKRVVFKALQCEIHASLNGLFDKTDEDLKKSIEKRPDVYQVVLDYVRAKGKRSSLWKEISGYLKDSTVIQL